MADDRNNEAGARAPMRQAAQARHELARNELEAALTTPATAFLGSRLPTPEFLSLTYTLPYHLVAQLDRLGQLTNRSQSELIAESIRLYLKTWATRREHTRISTVEGFSYQEVTVAEAGVATEWPDTIEGQAVETPAPEADPVQRSKPHDPVTEPFAPQPFTPEAGAPRAHVPEAQSLEPLAAEAIGTPSAAIQLDCEHEIDPELQFPTSVVLTPEQLEAPDHIADPAADVRRRLRKLSAEPRDSLRLRGALEDVMREVDVRDFSASNHSSSVAAMARRLAEAKGISGVMLQDVWLAGLLHDIGKACIPDDILQKRRPSPEEMSVIRQYPQFGAELLSLIPSLEPSAAMVATHQERWNGSGYPDGLQGNDIPVGAQIVALCDVYQVLTTARRYRPAYDEERARQIIQQSAGTLWSPDLVRLFLTQVVGGERQPR